jgi:hypothetical protein
MGPTRINWELATLCTCLRPCLHWQQLDGNTRQPELKPDLQLQAWNWKLERLIKRLNWLPRRVVWTRKQCQRWAHSLFNHVTATWSGRDSLLDRFWPSWTSILTQLNVVFDPAERRFDKEQRSLFWESMQDWFVERGYHLYRPVRKETCDRPGDYYLMLEPTTTFEGVNEFPHAFMGGDSGDDPTRTPYSIFYSVRRLFTLLSCWTKKVNDV